MPDSHPHLRALIETMRTLRGPGGCPWDAEQTHESLTPYLIEEVAELVEAVETGDREHLLEELGDVLYQILFHADIAQADPEHPFDIDDVAQRVNDKMRSRHPHVFADGDAKSVDDVVRRWEEIKAEEKKDRATVVEGVPQQLSSLARASAIVKRGKGYLETLPEDDSIATEQDLGEALLRLVRVARARGLDPDRALRMRVRELEGEITKAEQASSEGARGEEARG